MATNDKPNLNPFDANNGYTFTANTLLTITFVLFFLIILLISLHFYARWYHRRARRLRRRPYLVFYIDSDATPPTGLDPSVIQSLPVFVYSAHSDPVECAVCLSDFEDNESGRVLPKCNHTFHVECIDMWLQSHSTCPLCRSLVEPVVPPGDRPGPEVVIDVCEPGSSSGCHQAVGEENRSGRALCSSSSSIALRRKPSSVGVAIDVPLSRSFGREAEGSTASCRSPGSRLLSFKRILSRERKLSPSSPSSENCAVGCSSVCDRDRDESMS
ncbi:hypothetical protein K1719_006189 [Acacia pycnantha]|nr:hypothetical protein K1719_006189 [Acacia pycnantha]